MSHDPKIYVLQTAEGKVVADQVAVADGMWSRFAGLMLRSALPTGQGLCIRPCNSIHMFFMRMPLDVAFVDKDGKVLHLLHSIRPWRVSKLVRHAAAAIELPAGTLKAADVTAGSELRMVEAGTL